MKRYFTYLHTNSLLTLSLIALLLASCGTSRDRLQQEGDGIYGTSSVNRQVSETDQGLDNRNYYRQYFQTKADVYANEPDGDIIFTDVEGYTSVNAYVDEDGIIHEEEIHYSDSYGPWGETSEIHINVYNNPGWAYYNHWHRPMWWYRSGWGISYWHPWGGFYGPGWSWGWSYYGWGYPYYWGGWGYYGHPGIYYHPYHGGYSNYVAYNRGRRNMDHRPGRTASRDNATRANRSNQGRYSRTEVERRINNSRNAQNQNMRNTSNRVNQNMRGTPSQNNQARPVQQPRNEGSRAIQGNERSNPTNTTRPNTNTRNSGINRGGSTNMRSSGGSGMRGGGTTRGGGRGGRG